MKKFSILTILFITFTFYLNAQFKTDLDNKDNTFESIVKPESNLYLGFFNPENFSMKHSYSLLYSSFGSNSIGLGMYTNSMRYKFSSNLQARFDVSLVHSPFGSFSKNMTDKFTGIYVTRADLSYKPYDNVSISLRFRQVPSYLGYSQYGSMNYDPYFGYNSFFDDDDRLR
jgi:hypothetical protein